MASAIHGVRLVRCPNCRNLLPESANFPVYTCGGCGRILRAKYSLSRESVGLIQSNSSNATSSGALENGLPSSLAETTPCSTEVDNGVKKALDDQLSAQPLPSNNRPVKFESLEQKECSMDDDQVAAERTETDLSNVDADDMLESKEDVSLNTEIEKFPKVHLLGHESLNVSDGHIDSTESNSPNFASDDDTVFLSVRHDNSWRSSMSKALNYDDKMFSTDGRYNNHAQDDATSSSDSVVSNVNKAVGEHLVVDGMTIEAQTEADDIPTKSPNESNKPTVTSTFDAPKYKFHTRKDTSLGSADFHSVQNWFEPESDGFLRSPVKDEDLDEDLQVVKKGSPPSELKSLECVQLEILRKVDKLKYDINDLFHVSVENKCDSQLGGNRDYHQRFDLGDNRLEAHKRREKFRQQCKFGQIASLLPPGTCLQCLHEGCQKPPKTSRNILCSDGFCKTCSNNISSLPYNKVQKHDHNIEEMDHKGKRKHAKHHCRPVLRGAPFVICYNCLRLLQLPLDFIVTRKQFYRLQCGACTKILRFSFRATNCSVMQTPIQSAPNEVKHPPSEVDSNNDSVPELEISRLKDNQQQDPVPYSDEYAFPLGLSYLADIESPLHIQRNSSDHMELKNNRLHRLMGYGSASRLLYQHSDTDEGFESSSVSEEEYVGNGLKGKEIFFPQYSARKQSRLHQNSR